MSDLLRLPLSPLLALLANASLVFACGLLLGSMRRVGPAQRHTVLLASLCGALAVPLLTVAAPHWDVAVLPAVQQGARSAAVDPSGWTDARSAAPDAARASVAEMRSVSAAHRAGFAASGPTPAGREGPDHRSIAWILLIAIWPVGTLALLARLIVGRLRLRAIAARAWAPDGRSWTELLEAERRLAGVSRQVRFVVSPAATSPLTWGTRTPVVLLPEDALEWPAERRRIVLRHELAHVARGDALAQSLAALACAVYWFHPLALIAARRLRTECERACDERVVALGTQPCEYASHLLDVARAAREMSSPGLLSLAMARPSQLEGRLLALLHNSRSRAAPTRRVQATAISLPLALAIVGSAFHPVPREPTQAGGHAAARNSATIRTAANEPSIVPPSMPPPVSAQVGGVPPGAGMRPLAPTAAAPVATPVAERFVAPAPLRQDRFDTAPPARAGETSTGILQTRGDLTSRTAQHDGARADDIGPNVEILLRADLTLPSDAPVQVAMSGGENLVLVNDRFALPLDLRAAIELVKQIRAKYGRDIPGGSVQIQVASNSVRTMTTSDAEPYAQLLEGLLNAPMEEIHGRPAARHQLFEEHPEVEVAVSESTLARLLRRSP